MELKPGYKQTDVDVIPEDWTIDLLGNICASSSGTTPSRSLENRYYKDGTIHWVKTTDLTNSYITETEESVTEAALNETSLKIYPAGSVLVAMYGGFLQIGRTGLLRIPAAVNQAITAIQSNGIVLDPAYLINYLNFRVTYWRNVASSSRRDPNITGADIRRFPIAYPSLREQQAIAATLSDVDALISALDRLIAKKRDIKQAAMQELLTGKRRLPGFSGKWEVKQLGELFEITSSKRVFQSQWKTEGIPFYRARELAVLGEKGYVNNELFISREMYDAYKNIYGVPKIGDMLVTGVGTLGKVYVVSDDHEFYFKDGNIIWFKISGKVSSDFLKQLYSTPQMIKQIEDASAGTTVGTYTISGAMKTIIPFPSLDEQTAIAEVFSDMDAEIAALERKRDKTRLLKQGMMQELLTGRIRLI